MRVSLLATIRRLQESALSSARACTASGGDCQTRSLEPRFRHAAPALGSLHRPITVFCAHLGAPAFSAALPKGNANAPGAAPDSQTRFGLWRFKSSFLFEVFPHERSPLSTRPSTLHSLGYVTPVRGTYNASLHLARVSLSSSAAAGPKKKKKKKTTNTTNHTGPYPPDSAICAYPVLSPSTLVSARPNFLFFRQHVLVPPRRIWTRAHLPVADLGGNWFFSMSEITCPLIRFFFLDPPRTINHVRLDVRANQSAHNSFLKAQLVKLPFRSSQMIRTTQTFQDNYER